MNYEQIFKEAEELMSKDGQLANVAFKQVLEFFEGKTIEELTDYELRYYTLCYQRIFLYSGIKDCASASANESKKGFDMLISRDKLDADIYEDYILLLDLTYEYEKERDFLLGLLEDDGLKLMALKWLSVPTFEFNGLQSHEETKEYLEQRTELTTDIDEKERLIKALEDMNKGDAQIATWKSQHN